MPSMIELLECRQRFAKKPSPRIGQYDARILPLKQRYAQLVFETQNGATDTRLLYTETRCSLSKTSIFSCREKMPYLSELRHSRLPQHIRGFAFERPAVSSHRVLAASPTTATAGWLISPSALSLVALEAEPSILFSPLMIGSWNTQASRDRIAARYCITEHFL